MKCPTCGAKIGFLDMMAHKRMHRDEEAAGRSQAPPPKPPANKP